MSGLITVTKHANGYVIATDLMNELPVKVILESVLVLTKPTRCVLVG